MKKLLSKGKVIVSFLSVLAILAVSLLSVFTGGTFSAAAENDDSTVTYPLNGTYDADFTATDGESIYYLDVSDKYKDESGKLQDKIVSNFTGFETDFISKAKGNGSSGDPYIIETANQFAAVATGSLYEADGTLIDTTFKSFKVSDKVKAFNLSNTTSTVDFSKEMKSSDVEKELASANVKDGLNWVSKDKDGNDITDSSKQISFKGHFDGNGVVVYGLKATGVDYAGVFPWVSGNFVVNNLTVKNSYFSGNQAASAFVARNKKDTNYNNTQVIYTMNNCAAYGNVIIVNRKEANSIDYGGVLLGSVENYEASATINNCLVYDNIAKNSNLAITYGVLGRLHRTTSATYNNCILMDSVPHTLYYGSNAFHNTTYNNVYTNTMKGDQWENVDADYRYVYRYTIKTGGALDAEFNHYAKSDVNHENSLTYYGNGYSKSFNNVTVYAIDEATAKSGSAIEGLDSSSWSYNKDSYPTPKLYCAKDYYNGKGWTGRVASQFFEGDGTSTVPYVITSPEELALMLTMSDTTGLYFKLGRDIVLNDTTADDWTSKAKKWFTSNDVASFKGDFDGNGFTISGVYYDGSQAGEYAGAIPVAGSPSAVKKLTVANSELNAKKGAIGGAVGCIEDRAAKVIKISTITIKDTVKMSGNAKKGGIVGKVGYSVANITDCISESNGLIGDITGLVSVKRCISAGDVPFKVTAGVTAENVYTDTDGVAVDGVTVVSNDSMKGDAAKTSMPGLSFGVAWNTTTSYPVATGAAASSDGTKGEPWSGAVASGYAGGKGTEKDPYTIETAEQLAYFITKFTGKDNFELTYVKLTADIYLNDVNSPLWAEGIGCYDWYDQYVNYNKIYNLVFDGDGYVVHGLYYNTVGSTDRYVRVGLFPMISYNTTIKNLGISDAHLSGRFDYSGEAMGAIVGQVAAWMDEAKLDIKFEQKDKEYNATVRQDETFLEYQPKIIGCFVDYKSSVKTANYTGGMVGQVPNLGPILIEDCIFTGSIENGSSDQYWAGTLVGLDDSWSTTIRNSISFPQCGYKFMGGGTVATWRTSPEYHVLDTDNLYYFSTVKQPGIGVDGTITKITRPDDRIGESAKEAMDGLSWEEQEDDGGTWRVVEGGTPIQAIFAKHHTKEEYEKYSDKYFVAPEVKVSFMTNTSDVVVDDMVGTMYTKLTLPTVTRAGYKFTGWYVFDDLSIEYPYDYFPPRDLQLFAGWEATGVVQDFEKYTDTKWDYDSNCWRLNKPGAKGGYKNAYVRNGSNSMRLLSTNTESADVLLNYQDMLEPGKAYTITFWVATDKANNPATLLTLVHNEKPVYLDTAVAAENMAVVTGLKVGEWVQYSYSFTAQTKWVSLRATAGSSLYFDDIVIGKIDGTLNGGNLIGLGSSQLSPGTKDTVSTVALVSAIVACAVVAVISRKNLAEVID